MSAFLNMAYALGAKNAFDGFGEKTARIFGDSVPTGLDLAAVPYDLRRGDYESYLKTKSREAPTPYGTALGVGALSGGIPGALLGSLHSGRGAVAGGLGGAALGGLMGVGMAHNDRYAIAKAKNTLDEGKIDRHLAQHIHQTVAEEKRMRDRAREAQEEWRHRELLDAMPGRMSDR